MAQLLSDIRKRPNAPGCRLLEDLKALRQLEGAIDIIEAHERHAERNLRSFASGLRLRGSKTARADPLASPVRSQQQQV